MATQNDDSEVTPEDYIIPPNYEDAGGVFGGKLKTRNAIEAAVIAGPLAYMEFHVLKFSWSTNIIIMMFTLIPLTAGCLFGINKESITQYIFAYIRFRRHRRILHYDSFTDVSEKLSKKAWTVDSMLDYIAANGLKQTFMRITANHEDKKTSQEAANETESGNHETKVKRHVKHKRVAQATVKPSKEVALIKSENAHKKKLRPVNSLISPALKEKLIRKLELGEDDESD